MGFSHTSPVIVVEPQQWAQGCPDTPSETWQRAQDDSREEGLEGSLCSSEMVTVPATDPSEQELNLVTFFLSGEGANREAWASLALEKLTQLKDTLSVGHTRRSGVWYWDSTKEASSSG